MRKYLAHSAGKNPPVPPQEYSTHVLNVLERVEDNIDRLSQYYKGNLEYFRRAVRAAALFHDLGKLDERNQVALQQNAQRNLPINHVDAGAAFLLRQNQVESAFLIYSHHKGLCSIPEEVAKGELFLRDPNLQPYTDSKLQDYLSRHVEAGFTKDVSSEPMASDWNGLTRRIALSCLVDADHGDTAANYGREYPQSLPAPRWEERLQALDKYVKSLQAESQFADHRQELLQKIYLCCKNADTSPRLYTCDSPVGTGKTTAVMAHLLRAAIDKRFRHIIVVLPYTNIITQCVEVYRQALVLPGEKASEVIAEHYHHADFEAEEARHLAMLWRAPIIVTTAVQFFETIASNHPSKLRKLHELPGSGVFIDETHAAIPTHLWPQTWKWLKDLAYTWGCHFVLASGSLPRFWELKDMIEMPEKLPDLISQSLRSQALEYEKKRVSPIRFPEVLNIEKLIDLVLSKPGPRLVIMNTVQAAAVVADALATYLYDDEYSIDLTNSKVLHLSTSLAPVDREIIVRVVKERLELPLDDPRRDFTLVSTSCVEAGLDFSFRSAFRQRASVASLIQVGGRVRRKNENFEPILIDFIIEDRFINRHPAFTLSSQILGKLFDEGKIETNSPTDLVTEALRRELMSDVDMKYQRIQQKEAELEYPEVASMYKVITDNTILVLVDHKLIADLEEGKIVDYREINRRSVRIWTDTIPKTCAFPIANIPGLYGWPEEDYDPIFLGYMKGMLRLLKINSEGGAVI